MRGFTRRVVGGGLIIILLALSGMTPLHAIITSEALSQYVQKRVITHILKDPDIVTKDIQVKVKPENVDRVPKTATKFTVKIQEKATFGGNHILPVVFSDDSGKEIYQLPIHLHVNVFGKIFKASGQIEKGSIIDDSQVNQYYESINGLPQNRIRNLHEIVGYETMIALQDGSVITPYQIRRIPTIRSGQVISAKIQKRGFGLNIKVKAMENGYLGQRIKAKTLLDSGKMLEGTVINNETIEVNTLY